MIDGRILPEPEFERFDAAQCLNQGLKETRDGQEKKKKVICMNLEALNKLPVDQLKIELGKCCSAATWVNRMAAFFPVEDSESLLLQAEAVWFACSEADWREAFCGHPKIGDVDALKKKFASTAGWAGEEQAAIKQTSDVVLAALKKGNEEYEARFGYIFIVCATGKGADEMLRLLQARLNNSPTDEITIAMQEQNKITLIRLQKLLTP